MSMTVTSWRPGLRPRNAAGQVITRTGIPDEYYTPTDRTANTPLHGHDLSSLTSIASPVGTAGRKSEMRPGVSYSQAISRSRSPKPKAREETPIELAVHSNRNVMMSTPFVKHSTHARIEDGTDTDSQSAAAAGEDNDEAGAWTEVRYHKPVAAMRNYDALPQKETTRLLMVAQSSSASRGDGPSSLPKGKAVDPRKWGAAGLEPEELDVEAQQDLLEFYSSQKGGTPDEEGGPGTTRNPPMSSGGRPLNKLTMRPEMSKILESDTRGSPLRHCGLPVRWTDADMGTEVKLTSS